MKKVTLLFFATVTTSLFSCKNDDKKTETVTTQVQENIEQISTIDQFIIAYKGYVRAEPNDNAKKIDSLDFGASIKIKIADFDGESYEEGMENPYEAERSNGFVAVYKTTPKNSSEKPYGYVKEDILVNDYDIKKYKDYFTAPDFKKLTSAQKKLILDSEYHEGNAYNITQNAAKTKESIVYGDFDKDGIMDVAVTLENLENTYGMVLILLTNKNTKQPYIAYKKTFTDYLSIAKVKAGTSVDFEQYNSDTETAEVDVFMFDNDGIQVFANANPFYAIQYNNQTHKFMEHNL